MLRRAIASMEIAADAKQEGRKVVIAEKDRTPIAEILVWRSWRPVLTAVIALTDETAYSSAISGFVSRLIISH